ncbi:hypothetical protein EDC01DRAFT_779484 [Geopyxis carbonaria]|nr:hypothetical protein EDC01DRAFT_779484 [Geopyxis carbonaria]
MKIVLAFAAVVAVVSASPLEVRKEKSGDDYYNNEESKSDVDFSNITVKQAVDQCSGQKLSCCEDMKEVDEETKSLLGLEGILDFENTLGGTCAEVNIIEIAGDLLADKCNQTPACCSGDVKAEFALIQFGCVPLNGAL